VNNDKYIKVIQGKSEKTTGPNMLKQMKQRLQKIIETKLNTATIYPLNQFELAFGQLWGYGKQPKDLTDEEKRNLHLWQQIRKNILDNGNQQKRNLLAEIDMHDVVWKRFETSFIPTKGNL
jgi:hypothetical protein